ncbi:MAG: DUF1858 domain-containing protein [Anaerolineales bacterium]
MDKHKPQTRDLLNMKLDQLLSRWPAAAQVLIAYRMACIGCEFAKFHTTQQALEAYNLETSSFVEDLARSLDGSSDRGLD